MSLILMMRFRSQLKLLLPKQQSPKAKKSRRVSIESLCKSRSSDHKSQRISKKEIEIVIHRARTLSYDSNSTAYPTDKVKNCKPIKVRRWLESKRPSKWLSRSRIGGPLPREDPEINDKPPDYTDHGTIPDLELFLKLKVSEEEDEASWQVQYAGLVGCVDSIGHSQSLQHEVCGEPSSQIAENCTDPRPIVHLIELAQPPPDRGEPSSVNLENDFSSFYSKLVPFILAPRTDAGAPVPAVTDLNITDLWDNLFPDIAPSADIADASPVHGNNNAGPNQPPRIAPVLDKQVQGCPPQGSFSTPVLARVATWEIERLHKYASLESTPDPELHEAGVRHALSKFDHDFQNRGSVIGAGWRHPIFDDIIRGEGGKGLLAFDLSGNTRAHTENSTGSGRSYCDGAIQNSQSSGSVDRKLVLKRGRHENDQNEGKKRKKHDQPPQKPSRPFDGREENTFTCPFKNFSSTGPDTTVKACNTEFPNLSKVKEHLRRAHYPHLQCPHGCDFRAGSTFEINRHQRNKHPSSPPLQPIEQTINLDHLQKHKALKLRTLTWERISRICSSTEYTRKVLEEISDENDDESNLEGNESKIGDEGDEAPSSANGSEDREISETNESTPVTEFGNGVSGGYSVGPPTEGIMGNGLHSMCGGYSAFGGGDSWDNSETGVRLEQPPNNVPTEARPQEHTPNNPQESLLPQTIFLIIHHCFETMRRKLILQIFPYSEARDEAGIYTAMEATFEGFYHDIANNFSGSAVFDPQPDFPSGPDGVPVFTLPSSPVQSSNHIKSALRNPHHGNLVFSLAQNPSTDPDIYALMYPGQENPTTIHKHPPSPDQIPIELIAMLNVPTGTFPTGEQISVQNTYMHFVADAI